MLYRLSRRSLIGWSHLQLIAMVPVDSATSRLSSEMHDEMSVLHLLVSVAFVNRVVSSVVFVCLCILR